MGGSSSSRRRNPRTPIPPYTSGVGATPGISRPGATPAVGLGNASPILRNQQADLAQQVQALTAQVQALQRGSGILPPPIPYGGIGSAGGLGSTGTLPPPVPYNLPNTMVQNSPYGQPGGLLSQNFGGQSPFSYQSQRLMGGGGYRDTDYAAVANIAGLNPNDVALLHREYMTLTRGGSSKIDRTIFRQLLRDVLLEANNEHIDRAIENMFVTIDRNHDGFIDFPEFVGAFKDVLKGAPSDPFSHISEYGYPDILTEQLRASGVGSGIAANPMSYMDQMAAPQFISHGGFNVVPLASTGIQQLPLAYGNAAHLPITNGTTPLMTLDPSQSSYAIATPGQYLITQPTALQYMPLSVI